MASNLSLLKFCVLDKDARTAKFSFKLNGYSHVQSNRRSKPFRFGGHIWKLQVCKKKDYFGMFLRWYGTDRQLVSENLNLKCAATVTFSVINSLYLDDCVTEGTRNDVDVFEKLRGGIGYSKIIKLTELENSAGYVIQDTLSLQIKIKIIATSYYDRIDCKKPPDTDFVQGLKLPFYGTTWFLLFFPEGEDPKLQSKKSFQQKIQDLKKISFLPKFGKSKEENEQNKNNKTNEQACIYLMRQTDVTRALLRHNVCFMISVSGGSDFALEQHFYNEDSNVFGSASFMPIPKLRRVSIDNKIKVSVTFKEIVPYFYFAYDIKEKKGKIHFDKGIMFKDQYSHPWFFQLTADKTSDTVIASITLDPKKNNALVSSYKEKQRLIQVCWFAELLSPVNIERSLEFISRGKRNLQEATFTSSGDQDSVVFPISIEELASDDNPYVDDDGKLCVRISIIECNFVAENNVRQIQIATDPIKGEKVAFQQPVETAPGETPSLAGLDEKDILIQSLIDHIDAYEKYIKHLEKEPSKAFASHEETSIAALVKKCRPSLSDYENLSSIAKTIEDIIKTLPIAVEKVLHAGALGQGTIVANHYQLDFIVFMKNFDQKKSEINKILNMLQERLIEYCSTDSQDHSLDRTNSKTELPFASHFYRTTKALLFKLSCVNVTILLSKSLNDFNGYEDVYKKSAEATGEAVHRYNILLSERQVDFIDKQTELCKDLICVIKAWSDSIRWKDSDYRPSSYLLSLMLIHAYQKLERQPISQTPSFEKEVLVEFAMLVLDEELNIEWETYYNPEDYPLDKTNPIYVTPFVRDPANPYHNVAYTGITEWIQFREEIRDWISSLVY